MKKEKIAVFCGSHMAVNPLYEKDARLLGEQMAKEKRKLIYGGSNWGYMGIVSGAALENGAEVTGVIPEIFSDNVITSQKLSSLVIVKSMAERKQTIIEKADAFIALPGGVGTVDEVSEVLTSNQLGMCCKPVVLLNTDGFWNAFYSQMEKMHREGFIADDNFSTLFLAEDVNSALEICDGFVPKVFSSLEKIRRK